MTKENTEAASALAAHCLLGCWQQNGGPGVTPPLDGEYHGATRLSGPVLWARAVCRGVGSTCGALAMPGEQPIARACALLSGALGSRQHPLCPRQDEPQVPSVASDGDSGAAPWVLQGAGQSESVQGEGCQAPEPTGGASGPREGTKNPDFPPVCPHEGPEESTGRCPKRSDIWRTEPQVGPSLERRYPNLACLAEAAQACTVL